MFISVHKYAKEKYMRKMPSLYNKWYYLFSKVFMSWKLSLNYGDDFVSCHSQPKSWASVESKQQNAYNVIVTYCRNVKVNKSWPTLYQWRKKLFTGILQSQRSLWSFQHWIGALSWIMLPFNTMYVSLGQRFRENITEFSHSSTTSCLCNVHPKSNCLIIGHFKFSNKGDRSIDVTCQTWPFPFTFCIR